MFIVTECASGFDWSYTEPIAASICKDKCEEFIKNEEIEIERIKNLFPLLIEELKSLDEENPIHILRTEVKMHNNKSIYLNDNDRLQKDLLSWKNEIQTIIDQFICKYNIRERYKSMFKDRSIKLLDDIYFEIVEVDDL